MAIFYSEKDIKCPACGNTLLRYEEHYLLERDNKDKNKIKKTQIEHAYYCCKCGEKAYEEKP